MKKLITSMAVLFLLAGCGSPASGSYGAADYKEEYYAPAEAEIDTDAGTYYNDSAVVSQAKAEEKLVYTGNLDLETREYDAYTKEFFGIVNKYAGITQNMNEYTRAERRYMNMTVRIPAKDFDNFLNDVRTGSGSVVSISTNVDNITKRYADNDLQIASLETQHERLLELLAQAEDLSDVVLLEERLSNVEYQLNSLKSYKGDMDEDVAYSTITVSISEVSVYTRTSFGQRLKEAFGDSWMNFFEWLQDFVIGIVYALPMILFLAAVYFLIRKPFAKWLIRRRERRAAKKAAKEA